MESLSLQGRVAIVTGSSAGIGAAAAKLMARRGAKVTLHGRDQSKLDAVKEELTKAGVKHDQVCSVRGDITDAAVRENLVAETVKTFGRIDILVNNAGSIEHNSVLREVTHEQLTRSMDLLLNAPVLLAQLCLPHLAKTKGNIINISAVGTSSATPGLFPFGAAKVALDLFTKYAAVEFANDGVRVNTIRPGPIRTSIDKQTEEQAAGLLKAIVDATLVKRMGTVEEMAEVIAFFASDAAKFYNGEVTSCDGGISVPLLFKPPAQ